MSGDERKAAVTDDQLLAQLGRALDELDAVPQDAVDVALSAFELGRVDAELADLLFDSLLDEEPVGMRHVGVQDARSLAFTSQGHRIDIELIDSDGTLLGQIDPATAAVVELEGPDGHRRVDADDLGRFRFDAVRGSLRLQISTSDEVLIVTPWITW